MYTHDLKVSSYVNSLKFLHRHPKISIFTLHTYMLKVQIIHQRWWISCPGIQAATNWTWTQTNKKWPSSPFIFKTSISSNAQLRSDVFPDMRLLHISLNTTHSESKPSSYIVYIYNVYTYKIQTYVMQSSIIEVYEIRMKGIVYLTF